MAFTGSGKTGGNPNDVPRDRHKRYLIPRYPVIGPGEAGMAPMAPDAEPIKGEGMEQPWTRVSTIAKAMADQFGLTRWQIRMVVKGISLRPDLYALAAATRIDDTGQLDDVGDQAKDAAKARAGGNLGTALHAFTDQVDAGETPEIPSPWDRDIAAYTKGLADHGIKIVKEWREQRVVLPDVRDGKAAGVAGTLDSIVLYNGVPTIADLKTGKDPLKYGAGEIAIQEGCYANASAFWDGEYFRPMPANLNKKVALVFHLRPGEARLDIYEVDISDAMADVALAMQVRAWRAKVKTLYTLITPGEPASEIAALEAEVQPDATDPTPAEVAQAIPTPLQAARVKSADELAQEAKRDERLAAISKATNPNDGDPDDAQTAGQAIAAQILGGTGKPLTPLAIPPAKGCSVCRRTGHRKGSPVCLGDADPAQVDRSIGDAERAAGEPEIKPDAIWCGCTNRSAGWKPDPSNPDGPWVCGDCGLPSKAMAVDQEMSDGDHDNRASAAKAVEDRTGNPEEDHAAATEVQPEDDPFADEPEVEPELVHPYSKANFLRLIAEAETKAQIRDIRTAATEHKVWDDDLLQAGLKRIGELAKQS